MICTLQHNWNVLTSIYNIIAPLCASVTKMQIFFFFIGNSKDAQVAVQQTHMLYHMQVHCHSNMPIESLAEARLIWRENLILF